MQHTQSETKKNTKTQLKQTNASDHLVRSRFKIREGSKKWNQKDYGGKE